MKLILAAFALLAPAAGFAQNAPAPAHAHAHGDAAPAPAATTPAPAARFNLDTPVEQLVAEPRAKAALDARVPELSGHAAFNMFKAMSLRALAPHSGGRLTPELMAQIEADLAAIR